MRFDEYRQHDAVALAELVARKETTPEELLMCALARAEAINPDLNAIVIPMHDIARARVNDKLSGPLAGVPFLIKDIAQDYAGVPATSGSRALRNHVPSTHAEYVVRALAAGLVIFGKTNTPEFALKGTTEPEYWGVTRNPWNRLHTTGGSSGGAAAAVAAGIVPMAGASDGGGSIRIPASCCGLFGLRPSRGRVPAGPRFAEFWHGASSEHVITRSVRDSAVMLDALNGADVGAPFQIRPPVRPYRDEVGRDPGRLRIGYSIRSPLGLGVDPACVSAVESCVALLRSLGHEVEEAEPAIDGQALAECFLTMYMGQTAANMAEAQRLTGAGEDEFELDTRALALLGRALSAGEYTRSLFRWNDFARALGAFHRTYDLYLTPTVATPPARIGEQDTPAWQQAALKPLLTLGLGKLLLHSGQVEKMASESLRRVPFTQLSNLTGTPSMSVPLHWTADGLPVGVQFVASFGDESTLFRLAAQLEQARPWFDRVPA
ncbi:MAG TPA: amidase [Moraxellaceae bacterium]|nr:amidase [Moraxellaceae bacterium]